MSKLIYKVEHLHNSNNVKTTMFSNKKEAIDFANTYKGLVWQKIYVGKEE